MAQSIPHILFKEWNILDWWDILMYGTTATHALSWFRRPSKVCRASVTLPPYNHVLNFCTIIRTITKSVIRKAYKVYSVNRYLRNLDLNTAYDFALRIAEGREFHRLAPYMLKDNFLTCKRHLGTCSWSSCLVLW